MNSQHRQFFTKSSHTSSRLFGILLILLLAISCERNDLPVAPDFDALGFAEARDAVRQQMLGVYETWQQAPQDAERNGKMGMHLSVYGKHAAARIFHERARALAPDEFRWTYYLAVALNELGQLDEAAAMFTEALKLDPEHTDSQIRLAALLLQTSRIEASRKLYQTITVEYPDRVEGWLGLGKAYHRFGDVDAAVTALRRARELGPNYGEVRYALALVLRETGNNDEAEGEFAAYQRYANNNIRSNDALIREVAALHLGDESFLAKASYLFSQRDFNGASGFYRKVLEINPVNADAWNGLIGSQLQLGKMDAAGATYRDALAAGVSYARLHLTYGKGLMSTGQFDTAREVIGKAIELDPHFAEAYSFLGAIEMQSGNHAAAAEQFRLSLVARPNDLRVRYFYTKALNAAGQFKLAAEELKPLLNDPNMDSSVALTELAISYHGLERKDEAIDTLKRARQATAKTNNTRMQQQIDLMLKDWQQ